MKKLASAPSSSAALLEAEPHGSTSSRPRKTKNRIDELEKFHRTESNGHSEPANLNEILRAMTALKKGQFGARLPLHWPGVSGKIADVFNELAELMEHSTQDLSRISRVVGREGKLNERLARGESQGDWARRI